MRKQRKRSAATRKGGLRAGAGVDPAEAVRFAGRQPHRPMAEKKTADQWFAEYGESHQHHANELIHWICVPAIFFSVLGFIWSIPLPETWEETAPWFNWSVVAIVAAVIFYVRLSAALSVGLLCFMALCYWGLELLELFTPWPVGRVCLAVFVLAWIGQFIGHRIEGKKPSFFKDVVFLLIGPAWLMSMVYRKCGQHY
jgi:uncharacterized membrane protein YGL010W